MRTQYKEGNYTLVNNENVSKCLYLTKSEAKTLLKLYYFLGFKSINLQDYTGLPEFKEHPSLNNQN